MREMGLFRRRAFLTGHELAGGIADAIEAKLGHAITPDIRYLSS
jgi:hypothetical protein